MRSAVRTAVFAICLCLSAQTLAVAQARQDVGPEDEVVRLDSELVEVPVVVRGKKGRSIPELTASDFLLTEDGVPQTIEARAARRVSLSLAILLDASGSSGDHLADILRAAREIVEQLGPEDRAMVVSFAGEVRVLCELTNDRAALAAAVRGFDPRGPTKLYEAVDATVRERLRGVTGRRAVLVLSDGEDTASRRRTRDSAIAACADANVTVYSLRYPWSAGDRRFRLGASQGGRVSGNDPEPPRLRDQFLEKIARESGGAVVEAPDAASLARLSRLVFEELNGAYLLAYAPKRPLAEGGFRRIEVTLPRHGDVKLTFRRGYRAATGAPSGAR